MPTVDQTLSILECLQAWWRLLASLQKFALVKAAIEKGLAKIEKWYKVTADSDMYFICLGILDIFSISSELTLQIP